MLYLSALGQPVIVLSSIQANTDLLLKKASVFSGRPYMAMVMDMWVVIYVAVLGKQFEIFNIVSDGKLVSSLPILARPGMGNAS